MVEAPGYCPPGPKCLFHPTIYRHSRLPGTPQIGNFPWNLKEDTGIVPPSADMAKFCEQLIWGPKRMKRLVFALTGVAALTLAACGSNNQDEVSNAELNQPAADLNEQANEAAMNAAEDAALGNRQQLNDENAAAPDNTTNPSDAQEQNVSGM